MISTDVASEQKNLAAETGVPAKQINTWFINARKRRRLR